MIKPRTAGPSPVTRVVVLAGVTIGLLGVALAAVAIGPWTAPPRESTPTKFTPPPEELSSRSVASVAPPAGGGVDLWPLFRTILLATIALVVIGIVAYVTVRWRDRLHWRSQRLDGPTDGVAHGSIPPAPAATAERTFDSRAAADYVIACWDELERAGALIGYGRRPEQTPTEFLDRLTGARTLDVRVGRALLSMYQRARFDHQALAPDTVAQAQWALKLLLSDLESTPADPPS